MYYSVLVPCWELVACSLMCLLTLIAAHTKAAILLQMQSGMASSQYHSSQAATMAWPTYSFLTWSTHQQHPEL
jgi:hypothetical protein